MIKHKIRYNYNFDITEIVELDSQNNILYWEERVYGNNGKIKHLRKSTGHEIEYSHTGKILREVGKPFANINNMIDIDLRFINNDFVIREYSISNIIPVMFRIPNDNKTSD